ncbi:hypothetical protein NY035_01790 [Corynebacterium diphtheriae bv. mitis]|uniref:hypothetical protein n=1 Tax=Corynebacterium diphtheriae TaxID=1717 RepID=UPI0018C8F238|nr:hypothetical protein [Corynebacterium diphtheriae]MBG9359030.1 hypothetical protein [Corynebacterium diphtheriae bv. mitis]MBG9361126.1 hypothetical protein [Corynebacterium diphtheriae bv. mitis]MBG9363291.1 hypothetical protein [Corynebacterium diphtheriae bv. mitis]MBG9365433.1 hypothetical protein [Corynebacterium diphtheriae bv. mitis]UWE84726.1 hypothetical protein NY053_05085 [Corynebacterium diphtheriae bv. mitis]
MTTLDKIPTDDLDQCRGMWVESTTGELGIIIDVIRRTFHPVKFRSHLAQVLRPAFELGSSARTYLSPLDSLTLRDDLPRTWEANGKPTQ